MSDHEIVCPFCSEKLTTTVEDGNVECPSCHEQIEFEGGFPVWAIFVCPSCGFDVFDLNGSEDLNCPECNQDFRLMEDGKPFGRKTECPFCGCMFYTECWSCECPECHKTFHLSEWELIGKFISCEYCGRMFYAEDQIQCSDCINGSKKTT